MITLAEKQNFQLALAELCTILKKPYKDVCNVCDGAGSVSKNSDNDCPKCKGSGSRFLRLL